MKYQIRLATVSDLPYVQKIYSKAQRFMAQHDNPDQWGTTYPSQTLLCQDIADRKLYVIYDESGIHGVFYFAMEPDATYTVIHEGNWTANKPYGVIHRIAGDGSGSILKTALAFARSRCSYVRIDTHADNYVMQHALEKYGFRRCGIIYIEDGTPRIAYDSVQGVREANTNDLKEIMALYLHLHEKAIPESSCKLLKTWKQIMDDPNHHLIVYEDRGNIVSSCVCVIVPNLTRNLRSYALIENVVTHQDYRNHGYGKACLGFAKEIAKREGCYKMMLLTGAKDLQTQSFYKSAGYNSSDKTAFIQWLDT